MHELPNVSFDQQRARLLARLTPEQQVVFDAAYYPHLREQLLQARDEDEFDPDQVELCMITAWRAHCNNLLLPDDDPAAPLPGYTVPVYLTTDGRVLTYVMEQLPMSASLRAPSVHDDAPATTAPARPVPRRALVLGTLTLLVALLWGWRVVLHSAAAADPAAPDVAATAAAMPSTDASPSPLSNAPTTAELADPVGLEVGDSGTQIWRVVRSEGVLGNPWTPPLEAGTAAWLGASVINPILCLPPADEAALRALRRGDAVTLRLASGVSRRYDVLHVRRVGQQEIEHFDQHALRLTLVACTVVGNERTVVEALYQIDPRVLPQMAQATDATIPDWLHVAWDAVEVSAGENSAQLRATFTITNTSRGEVHLDDVAGSLLVAGQAYPAQVEGLNGALADGATRTVTVTATLPPTTRRQNAVWQLMTPDGQQALLDVGILDW